MYKGLYSFVMGAYRAYPAVVAGDSSRAVMAACSVSHCATTSASGVLRRALRTSQ
ncbi:hypothetical protein D3C71_1850670 [compost metagenome]